MNYSTYRLSLDLHDTSSCKILYCKKGDTARQIAIDLNESGVPYLISEDCSAVLVATKPDKNGLFHACTIKNNVIYYQFTEQTAPVVGQVDCEIRLYGSDKEIITSAGFVLIVEDVEYTDGEIIDSETDFGGLRSLVAISEVEATVDNTVGTPSVTATLSGDSSERKLSFEFSGIKGDDYVLTEEDMDNIVSEVIGKLPESPEHSGDAVLYTPQDLTEEQKVQARENIGAVDELFVKENLDKKLSLTGGDIQGDTDTPLSICTPEDDMGGSFLWLGFKRSDYDIYKVGIDPGGGLVYQMYNTNYRIYNASEGITASDISTGTFKGQVKANASNQPAGTSLLRNSKLVSTDTNPTVNGEICWTYK